MSSRIFFAFAAVFSLILTGCASSKTSKDENADIEEQFGQIEEMDDDEIESVMESNAQMLDEDAAEDDEGERAEPESGKEEEDFIAYGLIAPEIDMIGTRRVELLMYSHDAMFPYYYDRSADRIIVHNVTAEYKDEFWVYDIAKKEATKVLSEDDLTLPEFQSFYSVYYCNDGFIVGTSNYDSALRVDLDGTVIVFPSDDIWQDDDVHKLLTVYEDGSQLWTGSSPDYIPLLVDKDFSGYQELPVPTITNEHGFESELSFQSLTFDWANRTFTRSIMHNGRIYTVCDNIAVYLDLSDMTWHQIDNKDLSGRPVDSVGKYILFGDRYIDEDTNSEEIYGLYDTQTGEYIKLPHLDSTNTGGYSYFPLFENNEIGYYGGNHSICKGLNFDENGTSHYGLAAVYKNADFITKDETMLVETEDYLKCHPISEKYYIFEDNYGIFLREYGKEGEETILKK